MKITRVEVTPLALPRTHPHVHRFGVLRTHEHLLVAVTIDDEVTGYAEASPKPWNPGGETMASVTTALRDLLGPAVVGQDPSRLNLLRHQIRLTNSNPMAHAALEMAALDAYARRIEQPVHRLLGGFSDSLACTALLSSGTPDSVAAEAVEAYDRLRVSSFKLKVGIEVGNDIAIANAVRAAVGPDALLYADANRGYSFAEASRFAEQTRDAGLAWFEEPCPSAGSLGRQDFVRRSPIPVLGDESCSTLEEAVASITAGSSNMVSLKPARSGAVETIRLRDFAETMGVEVLVGSSGESALGTYATASIAAAGAWSSRLPAELLMYQDLADDVVIELPTIVDGRFVIPDRPGFGFEIDLAKVKELSAGPSEVIAVPLGGTP